ncbi:UTRA domain-containing protein [Streptomyces sp. KL116D]|uniref:UTRA domain-containing protein n=1 Tax=Streptomyces sp. KL116D TaxID=3045152 RepID=UPI003557AE2C
MRTRTSRCASAWRSPRPLLYLERIRLADGEPLAHDKVWMLASDARALLDVDFSHTALLRRTRRALRHPSGRRRGAHQGRHPHGRRAEDSSACPTVWPRSPSSGSAVRTAAPSNGARPSSAATASASSPASTPAPGYRLDPAPAPSPARAGASPRGLDPVL